MSRGHETRPPADVLEKKTDKQRTSESKNLSHQSCLFDVTGNTIVRHLTGLVVFNTAVNTAVFKESQPFNSSDVIDIGSIVPDRIDQINKPAIES